METVTSNATRARREVVNDREYLVAPLNLIVPGVLNGSNGPLLYPPDEVAKNPGVWNGMPLVVYHPTDPETGKPTSARQPHVLAKSEVGRVFNTVADGKLTAEGWFDVKDTRRVDPRVLLALSRGQSIELSTGLFTENSPAPAGSVHNGRPYTHIARGYVPDHVAVLPDQRGACSIDDGCGVLVNESNHPEGKNMDREKTIQTLATNCDCFAKNADVLELLDDEQLAEIAAGQEVVNAVREAAPTLTVNAMPAAIKKKMAAKEDPEDAADGGADEDEENPDGTKKKKAKPMTTQNADEWLRAAPPEVRVVLNHAQSILDREKSAIVDRLVANVAAEKRPAHIEKLMKRDLSDLQDELERMPESATPLATNGYVGQFAGSPASYVGAAAPALNRAGPKDFDENESDESGRPVWNWEEVKKEHRKRD